MSEQKEVQCEEVLKRALLEEAKSLSNIVAGFTDAPQDATEYMTEEALDRAAGQTTDFTRLQETLKMVTDDKKDKKKDEELPKLATTCRKIHEANRVRRDVGIVRASHKQLMLGAVATAYERANKLTEKEKRT